MRRGGRKTNSSDAVIRRKYERLGWRVVHQGAPDFLLLKRGEAPRFVEAKSRYDPLRPEQVFWVRALRSLGAKCSVERVRSRVFTVGMDHLAYDRLDDLAKQHGWSVSAQAALYIEKGIEEDGK
jgi:hypothetical protein